MKNLTFGELCFFIFMSFSIICSAQPTPLDSTQLDSLFRAEQLHLLHLQKKQAHCNCDLNNEMVLSRAKLKAIEIKKAKLTKK